MKKRVSVSTVRLNTHYGLLGSIDVARQIGADAGGDKGETRGRFSCLLFY